MSPPPTRAEAGLLARLARNRAVTTAAAASVATGFAQFSAVVALGDVAAAFGELTPDDGTLAGAAGLSFTAMGLGLAAIRLASLGGLPLAAVADRRGRRRTLLIVLAAGLALTAAAATSQRFWWFVAALALARPGLSAVNAIAGVVAAEDADTRDRPAAMAAVTVGYGMGSGAVALVRAAVPGLLGFRGLFALALVVGAVVLPLLWRTLPEPSRFARLRRDDAGAAAGRAFDLGGPWRGPLRRRLVVMTATTMAVAFVAGPSTGLLFVYGENVLGVGPAVTAVAVVGAAPLGLVGLLLGRAGADRLGRRVTAATAQIAMAAAAAVTYSGTVTGLIGGYLAVLCASSAYAPPTGALAAELFPTRWRATAAGWLTIGGVVGAVAGLVVFGLASDAVDAPAGGALAVALPAAATAGAFALVPETRGRELDD